MPRSFSTASLSSMLDDETGEEWIILIAMEHPNWSVPKRFAYRRTSIESRGNTYFPAYFELTLPDQTPGQPPRWQLVIDNIDQTVISELRAVASAPSIVMDVIKASSPDTVEMTTGTDYKIQSYAYTLSTIVCEISMEDLIGEGFPGPRILPSNFPGGF